MKPKERDIMNSIIQYLNKTGQYWVWRVNTGAVQRDYTRKFDNKTINSLVRFNTPGTPDILGIQQGTGRFIGLEVKTPERKSKVTVQQQNFLYMINAYGGIGAVVTSIEDVDRVLKQFE